MFRKITTLITTLVVAFAMLPALAASAAVQTTASIVTPSPREIFPTMTGEAQTPLTVRVNNPQGSILDMGNALPANAVRVVMPIGLSNPVCGDTQPQGWTCQAVITPNASAVIFSTTTDPIARGGSRDFTFNAKVGAPGNSDRASTVEVEVSDDLGQTFTDSTASAAGALTLTTKILQIVPGTLATALGSNAQSRFTEGQAITASFQIRNYAVGAVDVTPALGGVASSDTAAADTPTVNVPGRGGVGTASFTITTAGTSALSRTSTYTASASIPTSTPVTTSNTVAFAPTTIERAISLATGVTRFAPRAIPDNQTRNFTIAVDKDELPGLTGLTGELVLTRKDTGTALAPIAIASPAGLDRIASGLQTTTIAFEATTLNLGLLNVSVNLDGALTVRGTDDNGKAFTQTISLPDLLTIDALAPTINLNPLTIVNPAANQTRANGGNTIRITGNVVDNDVTLQNRPDATSSGVVVAVEVGGQTLPVTVTFNGKNFTGNFPVSSVPVGTDFGAITAKASAYDLAQNVGDATPVQIEFDRIKPALALNGIAIIDPLYDTKPVVKVSFVEQFATPNVRGGCLETMWEVDNTVVTDVRYEDGTECQIGQAGPSNVRILVLNDRINPENAGTVDFIADRLGLGLGDDPVRDSAVNSAITAARAIVSGVAPTIPTILDITRTNTTGADVNDVPRESMGLLNSVYYTNVNNATDPVVFLDPANVSNTYTIEIYNAPQGGTRVASASAADGNRQVSNVPIGVCGVDCERNTTLYAELVNVVTQNGSPVTLRSPRRAFTIGYDTVIPRIVQAESASLSSVTVTYNEALRFGRNAGADWFALENNAFASEDESDYFAYGVDAVSLVDGQPNKRLLSVNRGDNGSFAGVDFFSTAMIPATSVYEDFAGNFSATAQSFIR